MNSNDDEKKIQQLFREFNPTLPAGFMERVDARLRSVESIKAYQRAERRRSHRALLLAAVCGSVTGALLMHLMPGIARILTAFDLTPSVIAVAAWLPVAIGAILAGLGTYFADVKTRM